MHFLIIQNEFVLIYTFFKRKRLKAVSFKTRATLGNTFFSRCILLKYTAFLEISQRIRQPRHRLPPTQRTVPVRDWSLLVYIGPIMVLLFDFLYVAERIR